MIKLADMAADWRLSFFSPSLQLQLDYGDGVPYLLNRFTHCSDNIQMIGARDDMNCSRLFMSHLVSMTFILLPPVILNLVEGTNVLEQIKIPRK